MQPENLLFSNLVNNSGTHHGYTQDNGKNNELLCPHFLMYYDIVGPGMVLYRVVKLYCYETISING